MYNNCRAKWELRTHHVMNWIITVPWSRFFKFSKHTPRDLSSEIYGVFSELHMWHDFCFSQFRSTTTSWHANAFCITSPLRCTDHRHLDSPHNGPVIPLMFPLLLAWTCHWTNNQDASDLRCHVASLYGLICNPLSCLTSSGRSAMPWISK